MFSCQRIVHSQHLLGTFLPLGYVHTKFRLSNIPFLASVLLPAYEAALDFDSFHDIRTIATSRKNILGKLTAVRRFLRGGVMRCSPEESNAVIFVGSCEGTPVGSYQTVRRHWQEDINALFTALSTLNLVKMEWFRK